MTSNQPPEHHVLTKDGNASAEVEVAIEALGSARAARLHRYFYVTRANQTVVMAEGADAPIAVALRSRVGWREPAGEQIG